MPNPASDGLTQKPARGTEGANGTPGGARLLQRPVRQRATRSRSPAATKTQRLARAPDGSPPQAARRQPPCRTGGDHATRCNAGAGAAAASHSDSRPSRGWMERRCGRGPPRGCGSEAMRARRGGSDPSDRNSSTQQPRRRFGCGNHHPSIARLHNGSKFSCEGAAKPNRMVAPPQARGLPKAAKAARAETRVRGGTTSAVGKTAFVC